MTEHIAQIMNLSFLQGIWPDALKTAEVGPIHKSKEKYKSGNLYKSTELLIDFKLNIKKFRRKCSVIATSPLMT